MCGLKKKKLVQRSGSSEYESVPFSKDAPIQYQNIGNKQLIKYLPNKLHTSNHFDKSVPVEDIESISNQSWRTEQFEKAGNLDLLKQKTPFNEISLNKGMTITPVTCDCCINEDHQRTNIQAKTVTSAADMEANTLIDTIIEKVDIYYKTLMMRMLRNILHLLQRKAFLEHQEVNCRKQQNSLFKALIAINPNQVDNISQPELDHESEKIIEQINEHRLKKQTITNKWEEIDTEIKTLYAEIDVQQWQRNQITKKVSELRDNF